MKKRYLIFLLLIVALLFIVGSWLFLHPIIENSAKNKTTLIRTQADSLFVQTSLAGITGDYYKILISYFPFTNRNYDSSTDYLFLQDKIYYSISDDTVFIYSKIKPIIPTFWNSKTLIKLVTIDMQSEDYYFHKMKIDKKKLEQISVY